MVLVTQYKNKYAEIFKNYENIFTHSLFLDMELEYFRKNSRVVKKSMACSGLIMGNWYISKKQAERLTITHSEWSSLKNRYMRVSAAEKHNE